MNVKNYCSVHHYYYNGLACPYCMADKSSILYEKVYKEGSVVDKRHKKEKQQTNNNITMEDINKLVKKYNVRH